MDGNISSCLSIGWKQSNFVKKSCCSYLYCNFSLISLYLNENRDQRGDGKIMEKWRWRIKDSELEIQE